MDKRKERGRLVAAETKRLRQANPKLDQKTAFGMAAKNMAGKKSVVKKKSKK
jgi:hypothetical protein